MNKPKPEHSGYKATDLDGTLAFHNPGDGVKTGGDPIPRHLERVKQWLADGWEVRIITARVSPEWNDRAEQTKLIQDWTEKHLGVRLMVQAHKCGQMRELWDDRAVGVVPNTGFSDVEVLNEILGYDVKYAIEGGAFAEEKDGFVRIDLCVPDFPSYSASPREARVLVARLLAAAEVVDSEASNG